MTMKAIEKMILRAEEIATNSENRELEAAFWSFVDTTTIAMASYTIDTRTRKFIDSLTRNDNGNFTILANLGKKASSIVALSSNAFAAHALELDDWLPSGMIHPGASIVPSVFLIAEENSLSIKDILKGIIFGYELAEQLGSWLGRTHYNSWHNTSTVGGMSVAATLSWLRGKELKEILNSVYSAATYSGGLMPLINRIVSIKPLSAVHAAVIGYLSSVLGSNLLSSSRTTSDIENRICAHFSKKCNNIDENSIKNKQAAILRVGYKIFPVCRNSHTAIQSAIKLHNRIGQIPWDSISKIVIETFQEAYQVADIVEPENIEEAKFSLTFLTAVALVKGWVGFKELYESLNDQEIRKLEKKVIVKIREDFTESFPDKQPTKVTVFLKNGFVIEEYEDIPYGDQKNKLNSDALINKIKGLAEYSKNTKILKFLNIMMEKDFNMNITEAIEAVKANEPMKATNKYDT